jgi:predicted PurR-regulated permease PerM
MATGLRPGEWRRIASTTAIVLSVGALFFLGYHALIGLRLILTYLAVAVFFTVVLSPAVDFLQHRAKMRRGLATAIVFVIGFSLLGAMGYAFIRPIVDQGQKFANNLPHIVNDAEKGKGPVGKIVKKYKVENYVKKNKAQLQKNIKNLGTPAIGVVRSIFNGIVGGVTTLVLTFLLLLQAPNISRGFFRLIHEQHRDRVRRVASESGRAVSGYMAGNLLISLFAAIGIYIFLRITGVPYPEVWALWVAFADLIPLVGATLGAIPTVAFAFLHSPAVGIACIIYFVAYQQFENHVLSVWIMARTVKVNPLTVLVSVLMGVELFGLLGALLAIPAAGVIQVVARDLWGEREAEVEPEPEASPAGADST